MNSRVVQILIPMAAAAGGMLVMLCIVAAFGFPLGPVMHGFIKAAVGSPERAAAALLVGCPLVLTGLGVCVAFRCGVWNIGAEGQYLAGALAATWLGLHVGKWPAWIAVPAVLAVAGLAGAAWAGIAAWLKQVRGVQEVLSTILLNFIAIQLVAMAAHGPLTDQASSSHDSTAAIAAPGRLPILWPAAGLHAGVLLAGAAALAVWFFLAHTVAGLRIRIVGGNAVAARLAGLPVAGYAAASFLLSGALAGLAGGVELAGNTYYLTASYAAGYGYTAIAVVMLARVSPLGVVPAALFFAFLDCGVRGLQSIDIPGLEQFPTALTFAAQGVVVLIAVLLAGPPRQVGDV